MFVENPLGIDATPEMVGGMLASALSDDSTRYTVSGQN